MLKTIKKSSPTLPLLLSLVILIGNCFLDFHSVHAEDTNVSVSITAGTLTLTNFPNNLTFDPITLTGSVQTTSGVLTNLVVTDARGSGAGWSVEVSATQFEKTGETSTKLDAGSLKLYSPAGITSPTNSSVPTIKSDGEPFVIDSGTSYKMVSADVNAGLGVWTISWDPADLQLTLNPGTTKAGAYTSKITWQLNQAPAS